MKYIITILIIPFLFQQCTSVNSQKHNKESSSSIRKVLYDQQEAWNTGDIELFMEGYWHSDSLSFIGSSGITYGWDNTLARYQKTYPDKTTMGELKFDILDLESLSPTCQKMIGRYTLIRESDEPTGLFTLIWKKIDGNWVIVSDQTC